MPRPHQNLDLFLYVGLAIEVLGLALIISHASSIFRIGIPMIVSGLILIGVYLFGRTMQIRRLHGRLNSDALFTLMQGLIVVILAVDEAALAANTSLGQHFMSTEVLRWTARLLVVALAAAVASGLYHHANRRPRQTSGR
jgi:uncharacterized membrane protein